MTGLVLDSGLDFHKVKISKWQGDKVAKLGSRLPLQTSLRLGEVDDHEASRF
jgi:hypothetical protein